MNVLISDRKIGRDIRRGHNPNSIAIYSQNTTTWCSGSTTTPIIGSHHLQQPWNSQRELRMMFQRQVLKFIILRLIIRMASELNKWALTSICKTPKQKTTLIIYKRPLLIKNPIKIRKQLSSSFRRRLKNVRLKQSFIRRSTSRSKALMKICKGSWICDPLIGLPVVDLQIWRVRIIGQLLVFPKGQAVRTTWWDSTNTSLRWSK